MFEIHVSSALSAASCRYLRWLPFSWAAWRVSIRRLGATRGAQGGVVMAAAGARWLAGLPAEWSAELAEQGGHVGTDPFLGDESVGDTVELVADVLDGVAGGGDAEELAGVSA